MPFPIEQGGSRLTGAATPQWCTHAERRNQTDLALRLMTKMGNQASCPPPTHILCAY
jgi:hypothetical protein